MATEHSPFTRPAHRRCGRAADQALSTHHRKQPKSRLSPRHQKLLPASAARPQSRVGKAPADSLMNTMG